MSADQLAIQGVVFDLFGTLVDAPSCFDAYVAAARLASVLKVRTTTVQEYLVTSFDARHTELASMAALSADMVAVTGSRTSPQQVSDMLLRIAGARLLPDDSVIGGLTSLRRSRLAVGVLSDATADIAAAWSTSPLATVVNVANFSATIGVTKPNWDSYAAICDSLGIPPQTLLYCGDGGGDELAGAAQFGFAAVTAVSRRGGPGTLAFRARPWGGLARRNVEQFIGLTLNKVDEL